ncbi:S-phase kinase-associated protein 1-like [Arabidopsis thaliana x Arabidopsis arenosa]|uniref:SKP1-like protein n=1 Tax=Arabidopsis thaliana x Arabidopsis arenosa TaxID=1240361 RepID=A0A8T2B0D1_9BRAS|nr:S-phase kinase-associated protein 1-like [Arabidopsis thaliana x Arabidopsis arenosa]
MSSNKIVLTSSDDESFEVDEAVARKLEIIPDMIADDKAILLQNVTGMILAIIIEYCKKHVDDVDSEAKNELVMTWDAEFMKNIDMETLFKLLIAADYLKVKGLIDLTSQTIADYVKDKSPNEFREIFNIENDYTPEEEEELRKQNEWAFKDLN